MALSKSQMAFVAFWLVRHLQSQKIVRLNPFERLVKSIFICIYFYFEFSRFVSDTFNEFN